MKRKSPRGIPDFSKKPKGFNPAAHPAANPVLQKQAPPVSPKVVNVKPPSTSAKSGQRGT